VIPHGFPKISRSRSFPWKITQRRAVAAPGLLPSLVRVRHAGTATATGTGFPSAGRTIIAAGY
jgi:hypothetical protein